MVYSWDKYRSICREEGRLPLEECFRILPSALATGTDAPINSSSRLRGKGREDRGRMRLALPVRWTCVRMLQISPRRTILFRGSYLTEYVTYRAHVGSSPGTLRTQGNGFKKTVCSFHYRL